MKYLLFVACAGVLVASCKKPNDPANNYWRLGNASYRSGTVGHLDTMFYVDEPAHTLAIRFHSLPASDGMYRLADIAANNGDNYYEGGVEGTVQVRISEGRFTVDLDNIWMVRMPDGTDSLLLSAHLTEQ